ncbi:uncharacterized protein F5891DRAFT_112246 [Suillus fuscotomentosus]|uniref:HMG box domain-containing protein n=1 Tax=Suillus fuscotomentosus TaxID=1912939 RepID=A0AAD4EBB6_9AGAM|nr:uncharacterized protein F5891DRAFT_112246 [Suillus fuscotomentosus]KAG1903020.1 hypothetical protein F5891DRAFT_112246 [Suillus fuscotomentosus]
MPAVRLSHRRRSSLAIAALHPIKAGIYGINTTPSPRSVTFAPNVTPVTFNETDECLSSPTPESSSPTTQLFPPSELPPTTTRRRVPPGKRRSLGYIPRPPNAFMLFRADFVRQKHVPGSIETNHGSLSKIIGNCWRALPLEEKRVWEIKAKHAKAEHKARYPEYRFRPVHNKNKEKKKEKATPTAEDERRCEEVAQLLLDGMKGDQLAAAIRKLDENKVHVPTPAYLLRRPSSVPLPDSRFGAAGITIPTLPFFAGSRPGSPVGKISRSARYILGQRRASSAQPTIPRHWGVAPPASWQRDESPLPEANTSLFEPSFFNSNFSSQTTQSDCAFSFNEMISTFPPHAPQDFGIAPLDPLHDLSLDINALNFNPNDPSAWMSAEYSNSQTSSPYSGSPAHSDMSLPVAAPQPQHAVAQFDHWPDMSQQYTIPVKGLDCLQGSGEQQIMEPQFSGYSTGIEGLFPPLGVVDTHGPHMMGFDYNSYCLS